MDDIETQSQPSGLLGMDDKPPAAEGAGKDTEEQEISTSEKAIVKQWQTRVSDSKKHWSSDFKRMRENMEFVFGLQRPSQAAMEGDAYQANFTLRMINQKVATLYAKNPRVTASRRKRMDFALWDGKVETILQVGAQINAAMTMGQMLAQKTGNPAMAHAAMQLVPPQAQSMMFDFQQGMERREIVNKVAETLEHVFHYQMDSQQPDFKIQMKQAVRRACITGVAYMRVQFVRDYETEPTASETRSSTLDRVKRAREILEKLDKQELDEDSPEVETLKSFVAGIAATSQGQDKTRIKERLVFDFPPATSIIPDENCRNLVGFVGARFVAQEFILPLEFVNAFYEVDIKVGGEGNAKEFNDGGEESPKNSEPKKMPQVKPRVCLWQVRDLDTKTDFVLVDGHDEWVQKPEPIDPEPSTFWDTFALVFNDCEVELGTKASIFPPSDVDLIKPMQREWNDAREDRRRDRRACQKKFIYPEGSIPEETLDKLENAETCNFVPIKGLKPDQDPRTVIGILDAGQINPALHDTGVLEQDFLLAVGAQEANIGPAQPNVTATNSNISEQSRITVASSNVDDLDMFLTQAALCGGELLLWEMHPDIVKHIAGVGGVWPDENRADFVNELNLETLAASSGRPNKAVDIANAREVMPLIMQAAGMPPEAQKTIQAVIRYLCKTLDANIEPEDFFPTMPPMGAPPPQAPPQAAPQAGKGRTPGRAPSKQVPQANASRPVPGRGVPMVGPPGAAMRA